MRTPSRPRAALYRIGRWPCEAVCALRLRLKINKKTGMKSGFYLFRLGGLYITRPHTATLCK